MPDQTIIEQARRICAQARPEYADGFLSGEYDESSTEMRAVLIALGQGSAVLPTQDTGAIKASVQDDDAERLMREFYLSASYDPKAKRPADNVKAAIAFAIERLSRLSPTPETGLVEALTKCRVFFQHATAQNTRAILAEIDTALSNVSRLDANAERL
jgi:flagellin-like hook-associated protein FlgL